MQKILLLLTIILAQYIAPAQSSKITQITIKGKVTDEKGEPLAYANIYYKKPLTGTLADGSFECIVNTLPAEITVSYVGYSTQKVLVTTANYKNLTIVLKKTAITTDEVVVVGYAAPRKSMSVASSVERIRESDVREMPAPSVAAALETKVPGLEVSTATTGGKVNKTAHKSKLLTASEINDFKKWTLWNDYNEKDFLAFAASYNMNYTKRFSIQLVNANKTALVNKSVQLLDKTTNTILWQTKTDNTGKAELWNTEEKINKKEKYVVVVDGKTEYAVSSFEQGVNILQYNEACNITDKVDIAFIVDATGSMQDEIDYLKDELGDILNQLKTTHTATEFSFASVFYRDYYDAYITKSTPFTKDIKTVTDFIQLQNADGGGDYPEAVVSALTYSIDSLQWQEDAKTRIAFLILDAPPHENEIEKYKKLMSQYAAKGIRVIPIVCSGAQKSVEFLMRNIALATNGIYTFLTDDSGIGGKHLKPTTDAFKVQLLNALMLSLINQMIYTNPCSMDKKTQKQVNPYTTDTKTTLEVRVYPNPTRGYCTLESTEAMKEIFIADFTGKILQKISITNETVEDIPLHLEKYPSGTYIIKYITEDDKTGTLKIVRL